MTRAFRPSSLSEALAVLADFELDALPVAGCTDLMVGEVEPRNVVDLLCIPELRGIELRDGQIDIGAAVTFSQLRRDPHVQGELPILAEAAATIGGWQIQNRATLGGNIANASPAGDSLPVLLALDAELLLAGPDGERGIPFTDMHTAYRQTALRPGELITRVRIPRPPESCVQRFRKVGTREALAISKVVLAFAAAVSDGVLSHVRLAAGSVAPTPIRLRGAEAVLEGQAPDYALAERAALAARAGASPIDDVRSTARYRSFVLGRVVRRIVLQGRI
ncbi:MAG: FAD binding domain-containing protein [Gaiellales bacterium]